jgi:Mg/Co/Ni transporter MgtE
MKSNRTLLGVIGIIAAAVIIYLGFFNSEPNGEDLQATIGTVAKHQNEQISSDDVVLAGEETTDWSDDPVVVEAMASILERATIAQRSFAYLATGRQARADLLMAANAKDRSAVLGKVDFAEQVAAFNRVEKNTQKAMFARMEMNKADFGAMSMDKQVAALGSLDAKYRADVLGRVSMNAQLGAVAKADPAIHSEILGRASRHELARVYMAAPELNRVQMFNSLPLNERQSMMGKVFVQSSNSLLQRATPVEVENLRNQMSEKNAADLFGASSVHDQLAWAGRAVKSSPGSFDMLGRAQKHDTMGRLFLGATSKEKVAFFRAQPVDVQNDLYGKMSIKQAAWAEMDLNARAKALSSLSLERQAAMLARVDKNFVIDLAGRADKSIQKEFVGGLSRVEMSNALKLGASSREIHDALGRKPAIRNAVFTEIPADVQIRIMGRMVKTESFTD